MIWAVQLQNALHALVKRRPTNWSELPYLQFLLTYLNYAMSSSLNQGLLLEQERLASDYEKLKAEDQEKDSKLQNLM